MLGFGTTEKWRGMAINPNYIGSSALAAKERPKGTEEQVRRYSAAGI